MDQNQEENTLTDVENVQNEENTPEKEPVETKEEEEAVDELTALKTKIASYEDLIKRQAADFDNFRKRNLEEKEKLKEYAFDSIFLDFIPIFDNIERAFDAAQEESVKIESITEGLSGIMQLFNSFLEKYQVSKLDSINKEFDPSIHEALFTQEGDYDKKIVIQEVEKAYMRKDKAVRTAKVAVGVPKKIETEEKK